MAEKHPHFEYQPIVSREDVKDMPRGHVTKLLETQDFTGYKTYLCGTSAMVKGVHKIVTGNGLKPEDFFYESEDHISDLTNRVKGYESPTEQEKERLVG